MADKGLIQRSTLQAIANAIREKTGETAQMLPANMAGLISAISGSPFPSDVVTNLYVGTVVPATNMIYGSLEINHNLGVIPDAVLLFRAAASTPASGEILYITMIGNPLSPKYAYSTTYYTPSDQYSILSTSTSYSEATPSDAATVTKFASFTSNRKLVAGTTYITMALKFA